MKKNRVLQRNVQIHIHYMPIIYYVGFCLLQLHVYIDMLIHILRVGPCKNSKILKSFRGLQKSAKKYPGAVPAQGYSGPGGTGDLGHLGA